MKRRVLWWVALLTLGLCAAIAFDLTPWLRGPSGHFEWRWGYRPFSLRPLALVPVAFTAGLLGGWYWLARRRERAGGWLLAALVPIGLALQLSVLSTGPRGLEMVARVLNPGYFGYFGPATQVTDIVGFVDTYAEQQSHFDHPRLQTHPPGNVVFHWLVLRSVRAAPVLTELARPTVTSRIATLPEWIDSYDVTEIVGGAVASLLIPALGVMAAVPLFVLARRGFGEEAARRVALLYLLAPSLTLFAPKIDVMYTLLTSVAFLLAYVGVRRDAWWLILLSGLVCSAGTFMSYSLLPLSLAVGLFVSVTGLAGWRADRRAAIRRLGLRLAAFGLGAVGVQIGAQLAMGFAPVQSFLVMLGRTAPYNDARNYWYSLFYTPYDILLFAGIPVSALLVRRVVRLVRGGQWPSAEDWLLIGALVAIGALILTGVQKAENARVFVYFMPVIVLFGAAESEEIGWGWPEFALLAGLTLVQLVVFQAVLKVFL